MKTTNRSIAGMLAAIAAVGDGVSFGGHGTGRGMRLHPERNDGFDDVYIIRAVTKRQRKQERRKWEMARTQLGNHFQHHRFWLLNYYTQGPQR